MSTHSIPDPFLVSNKTVRQRIVAYLVEHGDSTPKTVAKGLSDASEGYVRSELVALNREGLISRKSHGVYGPVPDEDGAIVRHNPSLVREGADFSEHVDLVVYLHLKASAGPGGAGWEPDDESDAVRLHESKRFIAELLGFWPSDELRGLRIEGDSANGGRTPLASGQIILFEPAISIEASGRYVLAITAGEDDARVLVKRVQAFTGGGVRLVSEGAGYEDEILIPTPDGEALIHKVTGQIVELGVIGRVVWPRDGMDAETSALISATIERMIETAPWR